jgi:hypothetical protein
MPRKSKKKKRKAINWPVVIWTLFVLNVLWGLLYSPLTSIRHMRVVGAQPHDAQRIDSLAQNLRGRPFARVGAAQFESAVLGQRDVYDARLSHNLFGSALVKVTYRQPVAVLGSDPHTYLDGQGVIFGSPEEITGVRRLDLDPAYAQPGVALTLPWPSQQVAELCIKLNSFDQLRDAAVHLDTTGRLLISREDNHAIDLGGTAQLDEKLAKLKSILEADPQLLDHVQSLSLADPTHPASKPL